jgi:hypothetical protein
VDDSDHQRPEPVAMPADVTDGSVPAVTGSDSTAPASVTNARVTLAAPHPTISWANPNSADFAHVGISRYDGAAATGTPVLLQPDWRARSDTDTVTAGQTYTYVLTPYDTSGNPGPSTTLTMQALHAPRVGEPGYVSSWSTRLPFGVVWWESPFGPTRSARYDVRWWTAGRGWRTWMTHTSSTTAVFGQDGRPTAPKPGQHFQLSVRTVDAYGNRSAWRYGAESTEPYDQERGTRAGSWSLVRDSNDWGGSVRVSRHHGDSVTFTVSGRGTFTLIGRACPGCAAYAIYLDGRYQRAGFSNAQANNQRLPLDRVAIRAPGTHHIRIVNTGGGNGRLWIDGYAITRLT